MSEEKKSIRARMIEACALMQNPTKTNVVNNPRFSYTYERLEDILAVVRPALLSCGLGLTQRCELHPDAGYQLVTAVYDGDGELVVDTRTFRDLPSAQDVGSWETYMRRYALRAAFGLCGEDDDGRAVSREQGGYAYQRPTQPQNPPQTARQALTARINAANAAYIDAVGDSGALREYVSATYIKPDGTPKGFVDCSDEELAQIASAWEQAAREAANA